jgi:hypothetical protein
MPAFEKIGLLFEGMDAIDQFFDFIKRGEHALVNLHPHLVLVPKYAGIVSLSIHAVYRGHNFHTHAFLPKQISLSLVARRSVVQPRQNTSVD